MAMVSDFVPYIVSNTGEVTEVQMQHLIRMAVASFMTDTHIAQDELYVELDCKGQDFLLDLPECQRLVGVMDVWEAPSNGSPLLDENTWSKLTPAGMARGRGDSVYKVNKVGRNPNKSVILDTTSTKQRRFCVIYSWKVASAACEIPDFILDDWVDAVIYRTMVYLHASLDFEGRSIGDADRAMAMYNYEVARAKTALRADYTRAVIRLKTPRNFY